MISDPNLSKYSALDVIDHFKLEPHPEGGHYKEVFRDDLTYHGRSVCTSIYFLLQEGEKSHWHRIDSSEIWHWYAGAPLSLNIFDETLAKLESQTLSSCFHDGHLPQIIIPKNCWQSAETKGLWTLVGCTVAPGFEFSNFEMAEPGWEPAV